MFVLSALICDDSPLISLRFLLMPSDKLSLPPLAAGALLEARLRLDDEGVDVIVGCLLWDCVLSFMLVIGSREELKGRCLSVCAL